MSRFSAYRLTEANSDGLLTVAALALGVLTSIPFGHTHDRSDWELALTLLAWLPLLVRSRWPFPVAVIVVALDTVHIAVAAHQSPPQTMIPAATMLAIYSLTVRSRPRVAWTVATATAAIQFAVGIASPLTAGTALLYLNWPLVSVVLGRLIAERRARISAAEQRAVAAEESKEAEARRQVAAERIRIARDLHDVLAHHIAVVNAQAGVAQYLLRTDLDAADKALTGIADNTRAALDELRVTLGVLRSDTDELDGRGPTPGADALPDLIATLRAAGMLIAATTSGTPRPLPTAADLALYRITQEALTNASKHAPGSAVSVEVAWAEASVVLVISNGRSTAETDAAGTGNGLIGMRERAAAAGGSCLAEPTATGGFSVVATLPAPAIAAPEPLSPIRERA